MTPGYDLNSPPSPFPFIALKEDQQLQFFVPPHQASSSLSSPIFFNITHQDQSASHPREPQKNQQKADKYIFHVGSSDHRVIPSSSVQPTVDSTKDGHESSISKLAVEAEDKRSDHESAKWMSSKMRVMPKMMNTGCAGTYKQERIIQKFHDQDQDKSGNYSSKSSNNIIRTCSDCNTTKTPLWRSGPQGPKSLCNACGIRQRKARRAMAAAANGMVLARDNSTRRSKMQSKEKKSRTGYTTQYKKPFNLPGPPHQRGDEISFEDFALSLSKNSALRRAFPKDEEEAAILLMALSCGLLHS